MLMKVQQVDMKGYSEIIVALCDRELIGKTLKEGKTELWVNPRFYEGDRVSESIAASVICSATIANLVGKKAVEVGIKAGIIDKGNVINIEGVPHAQMVRMRE